MESDKGPRLLSYANICELLLDALPEIRTLGQQQLPSYTWIGGDLPPPYVLFGVVYRRFIAHISDASDAPDLPKRASDFLERAVESPDSEVQNLIGLQVLDVIAHDAAVLANVAPYLGPKTKAELNRIASLGKAD